MKLSISNNLNKYWWPYFPLIIFLIQLSFILFFQAEAPFKDEIFFISASERFKDLSFDNLFHLAKDYPLPQPPLIYMLGGLAFHFSKPLLVMRIFNCLLATIINLMMISFIKKNRSTISSLNLFFPFLLIFNPYYQLISLYFYTDTFYLFFIMLIIWGHEKNHFLVTMLGCFFAPLVRQFGMIYPLGGIFNELIKENKITKSAVGYCLSLTGLLAIIIYWGALSPSPFITEKISRIRSEHGPIFFSYFFYYLSAMAFWIAPVIFGGIRKILFTKKSFFLFICVFALAFFFNPHRNYYHGIEQLGLYHTILKFFPPILARLIMGTFAALGFGYLLNLFQDRQIKAIYKLWIIFFFLLQMTNPLCWDKYILELILVIFFAHLSSRIPE